MSRIFTPVAAMLLLALVAMGTTVASIGLWITRPEDQSTRVALLEAKVREDEVVIARLRKQQSAANWSHAPSSLITSPGGASGVADTEGGAGAGKAAAGQQAQAAAAGPAGDAQAAPVAPVMTDRRLAEAEARYAGLINQLALQPDEKEAFKTLAARREDIRKDTFAKLADPSLTLPQRQAILADAKAQVAQVDDSMRQFLNNDTDFNTFQKWEAQSVERRQMDEMRPVFANNGVPLSPEQEATLQDQEWALRSSNGQNDPYSADTMAGRRIDQNYINSSLAKYDADSLTLERQAASYMTPAQVQALTAGRYQQRGQLEARLLTMARSSAR